MRRKEHGVALLLVLVLTIMIVAFMSTVLAYSMTHQKTTYALNNAVQGQYACEAVLEMVKEQVNLSGYDTNGNLWLIANSSPGGKLVYNDIAIGKALVDCTLYDLGNGLYRANAVAVVDKTTVRVTQELRGRDTFAKYLFFIDADSVNFGSSTVRGYVHSNKWINFYFGGAQFYKEVTAKMGFTYNAGANPGNTFFYGGSNPNAPHINMPSTNEIATLSNEAQGVYRVSNSSPEYSGFGSFNTELEFQGGTVVITAKKPTGQVLKQSTVPLPPNGLIFVEGNVTSIKGDIAGQCTVACMGSVDITGKIRYVDADGDPAYQLTDAAGNPVGDTPPGVVWDGTNYKYQPNPAYNPDTPSVLGIMAANSVRVTNGAPYNMELHAAIFSATGRWYCDLGLKKGNLRTLGSLVMQLGGWRYNSQGYGYAKSGEYIYDQSLLSYPPPYYLKVDKATFGPRFKG